MILGIFWMLVANGAALLGARALLGKVRSGRLATDALLFLLLRLLLISSAVLLAGVGRLLTPAGLGIAAAAALAVLLACGVHRGLPGNWRPPWSPWLTGVAALIALRLLFQAWFFAPYFGDVLSYHLPKVAEWVRDGGFSREMGSDPRVSFPAGFELLEIWWTVFLHHDVLIELAGIEVLLVGCSAAYALAREFGWSSSCAMGAAILAGMIPGLQLQATSCMNDGPVAALLAALAALIVSRVHPGLILAVAGLGLGVKPTFGFALPGLALLYFLSRRDPAAPPPSPRVALVVAAAGLLVGASWYLRNLVVFGNPVHPMGPGGMLSISGTPLQGFGPSPKSLGENFLGFINLWVYDHLAPPSASHRSVSNWGPASFAGGFPALIYLARSEPRLRRLALALAVSLVCVWLLVIFDAYSARFVLFFTIVPSLALARLVERHRPALLLAAAAVALQFASTIVPEELDRFNVSRIMRQPWRERTAAPPVLDHSTVLPLGYYSDYSGTPYWLYGPDYSRSVVYLRADNVDALLSELQRGGVRRFCTGVLGRKKRALLEDGVTRGIFRPEPGGLSYELLP